MDSDISYSAYGLEFSRLSSSSLVSGGYVNTLRRIATVNAQFINLYYEDEKFRQCISSSLCTVDGRVPYAVARLMGKLGEVSVVSGSDLVVAAAQESARSGRKLFLLGGRDDVNAAAVERLSKEFGARAAGYAPPQESYPFRDDTVELIFERLSVAAPKILLISFGAPKQEYFAYDYQQRLVEHGVEVSVGVGGAVDFFGGRLTRAPKVIQFLGLEGAFRLWQEPSAARLRRLIESFAFLRHLRD